ncbi:MAG: arylsulfatase [Saprospiraceae bacterium]|nr:arylsulfatase [Saprospiraceae bacterium]
MNPTRNSLLPLLLGLIYALGAVQCNEYNKSEDAPDLPNIVYILADDLGYGDVGAYNPESKINTPAIDALAQKGMRFTDAHSPSSVCTPTRYGILTGQYCWRSRLPRGVLRGYGRSIIEHDMLTVGELLQSAGYRTGMIGKWHLGVDWAIKPAYVDSIAHASVNEVGMVTEMDPDWIDFSKPPTNGPLQHGFDYSYFLPASLDMDPYCYLKNDTLVSIPDDYTPGNDLNTGYAGAFWRPGRIAPGFEFDEVLPTFTEQAQAFIDRHAVGEHPFFLYLPLAAPHTPWMPTSAYQGKSGAGQYGDFVEMVDAAIGAVLQTLADKGVIENTLVIFASDNGPFWKPEMIEQYDHRAAHLYRGMKADIWEGGHRIPFIVKWPGKVDTGSVCAQTTVLTNLLATAADVIGVQLDQKEMHDSHSIYPYLLGNQVEETAGQTAIHHSSRAVFAIRNGEWKLIEGLGSGGFSTPTSIDPQDGEAAGQLYNLANDPSETTNLFLQKPDIVAQLENELDAIRKRP